MTWQGEGAREEGNLSDECIVVVASLRFFKGRSRYTTVLTNYCKRIIMKVVFLLCNETKGRHQIVLAT